MTPLKRTFLRHRFLLTPLLLTPSAFLLAACGTAPASKPTHATGSAPAVSAAQASGGAAPESTSAGAPATLYARLGGAPAVGAVVDSFLKRVAADDRINGRFINVDLVRLRGLLVEFISQATGAKVEYTGRDMYDSHAGFQLVNEEFDALVEDLVGALNELKVPAVEQGQLLGAIGPLRSKIVNPPPAAAAKHDEALAKKAKQLATELRTAGMPQPADLVVKAVRARERGQRSYADQLFSAAERQLPEGRMDAVAPLFREGAPERITTTIKKLPADTPPQPKLAVGNSDDDLAGSKPYRSSLSGTLALEGGRDLLGVVALDPVGGAHGKRVPKQRSIEQRDRKFAPHLLAVPVGSTVSFPNFDPIYHNVFSLSPARAFDLGLYKNGESREMTFNKEGLIRLGCNLHANMSAHVVVVAAAHYVVTSPGGSFTFHKLTPGKYNLRAWREDGSEPISRVVDIHPGSNSLDLSIPRKSAEGANTDKFGVPRSAPPEATTAAETH